ncbi:phospho-sugar mutase [Pyrococcus horikoshii]|nr:phospho-sugar mutase [Pyrococcus horikoshii]HII60663.1 phospho-sugar mutase [Pyrococcus horikoshii]
MELYSSEKFNPEELALLGRAIGTVSQGTIVIGRDGRAISRYGKRALAVGIVSTGSTIMDVRLIPLVALKDFGKKKDYPFVYVYYHGGVKVEISGIDAEEVETILEKRTFVEAAPSDIGATVYYPNALEDILHDVIKHYNFKLDMKALVDCMNTPAVLLFPRISEKFSINVDLINDMMTSYLPPKPKEVFLQKLAKGSYDFGLRFRPDGIIEFYKDGDVKKFDSLWSLMDYLSSLITW